MAKHRVFAIFKDGSRKEIDLDSAGIKDTSVPIEVMVMARKELTLLEEKQLVRWEFEEDFC
jgi:hypothetical protein